MRLQRVPHPLQRRRRHLPAARPARTMPRPAPSRRLLLAAHFLRGRLPRPPNYPELAGHALPRVHRPRRRHPTPQQPKPRHPPPPPPRYRHRGRHARPRTLNPSRPRIQPLGRRAQDAVLPRRPRVPRRLRPGPVLEREGQGEGGWGARQSQFLFRSQGGEESCE